MAKTARSGDKVAIAEEKWLTELIAALQEGRPARTVPVPDAAPNALRDLSPLTAKTHVARLFGKLDARDRAQLVVAAYEAGLVVPGRPAL